MQLIIDRAINELHRALIGKYNSPCAFNRDTSTPKCAGKPNAIFIRSISALFRVKIFTDFNAKFRALHSPLPPLFFLLARVKVINSLFALFIIL